MSKHLSEKQKMEYLPLLIKRDGGFKCFYCNYPLGYYSFIYEHLNDNRNDNRLENIVLACGSCNNKKPDNYDMKIKANEKLKKNEDSNFVRERNYVEDKTPNDASTEIKINQSNFQITEQYVTERVATDGSIEYREALDSCVYLCKSRTGHGSQQSVRNYLATLTCAVAPFQIIKDENSTKLIVKRTTN
ncbi:Putative HNH endonuclease [Nitrosotalea devaniterrae]|uniref:HNH endonuclease n=1 Tax=Nitrosotalea devaniterrae TaxID=1078905 RepID=A0A128A361_9ARCH|nr:Putative HNH endonuclease [Candidatus Nitrosotalea devanaterra]